MTTAAARLVVIAPAELAAGFRLTGVFTAVATTPQEAGLIIDELLRDGERGVLAICSPLFAGLDEDVQRRLRRSVSPVVVELPTGKATDAEEVRRTRLAERLQHAVGYHFTFGDRS